MSTQRAAGRVLPSAKDNLVTTNSWLVMRRDCQEIARAAVDSNLMLVRDQEDQQRHTTEKHEPESGGQSPFKIFEHSVHAQAKDFLAQF
jgi:hypothetical protein